MKQHSYQYQKNQKQSCVKKNKPESDMDKPFFIKNQNTVENYVLLTLKNNNIIGAF